MHMMKVTVAVLSLAGTIIPATADTDILVGKTRITISMDGYSEEDVLTAIQAFRKSCQPLGGLFWSDVTEVHAHLRQETAPYRLERGFETTIHLRLEYADDPVFGPSYGTQVGTMAGHTLWYVLGGGPTPGYIAEKKASQYLCGLSFDPSGSSIFVEVPDLSILDRD